MQTGSEFIFRNTNLPQRCFKVFLDMRNEDKLCDVRINVENKTLSAHRLILAAAIPFFGEILFGEEEHTVSDIESSVFECLIDYAYSSELKITKENVKGLLSAACMLRMMDVQDACCDFLSGNLDAENVLSFHGFASHLGLSKLKKICDLYVKEHFEEVSKTGEFLNLPYTYVLELIGQDDLNVNGEEKVLESVLRWVKATNYERKSNLTELLQQVRMVLLKPLYLRDIVEKEELLRMSPPARDLVDEAKDYHLFPERRKSACHFSTQARQFFKITKGTQESCSNIYVLKAVTGLTVLRLDNQVWSREASYEFTILSGCCTVLNRKIYFFQGAYSYVYDPMKNEFKLLKSLAVPRKYMAAVSLRNKIFVCGGCIGDCEPLNVVECLNPETNEWSHLRSLETARFGLQTVSLGDYIYAIGGSNIKKIYGTVERYNFFTERWQYMSSMLTARCYLGAAVLSGKIYVVGGRTNTGGIECTATAEVYDPQINRWKFITDMYTARRRVPLLAFHGQLYAIGGDDSRNNFIYSCEVYDPKNDKWISGPSIDKHHHISGAVVL